MTAQLLLIVDDDPMMRQMLRQRLEAESFNIMEAALSRRAMDILEQYSVDLVLLDVHLPDSKDGAVIHDIRKHTNAPVIMISGDHNVAQKINSLRNGANDYLSKPFDFNELVARIQARLRDHHAAHETLHSPHDISEAVRVEFGAWVMDRSRFQIFNRDGDTGDLTSREFRLLETLMSQAHCVIRREDLCHAVEEENYQPSPRAIDIRIARIRKKVGDDAANPQIIKTIRGIGYMFDGNIRILE